MTTNNDTTALSADYIASTVAYLLARGRVKEAAYMARKSPQLTDAICRLAHVLTADTVSSKPRLGTGMSRDEQAALWERDTALARTILADAPDISTRELARRLSVGRVYDCHPQRASTIRRTLTGAASSASSGSGNGGELAPGSSRRQAQG